MAPIRKKSTESNKKGKDPKIPYQITNKEQDTRHLESPTWPWGITYGSVLGWMNLHLLPILMFARGTRGIDPQPPKKNNNGLPRGIRHRLVGPYHVDARLAAAQEPIPRQGNRSARNRFLCLLYSFLEVEGTNFLLFGLVYFRATLPQKRVKGHCA